MQGNSAFRRASKCVDPSLAQEDKRFAKDDKISG
jgi:hypothetical protein